MQLQERCSGLNGFNLTKIQKEICKAADDFAKGEFGPDLARDLDRGCQFPREVWQKAADLGFLGLQYPEADGGGGMSMLETVLVAEVLGRRDASLGLAMMLPQLSLEWLAASDNNTLKAQYLPLAAEGRCLIGAALDDLMPQASVNSEKSELSCEVVEAHCLLNGAKTMVLTADCADALVVMAKPKAEDEQFHVFLVKKDIEGMRVHHAEDMLGLRALQMAEVVFDGVRVEHAYRIAVEKPGSPRLAKVMSANWLLLAGMALGLGQGVLERSVGYVKQRSQFGRRIGLFQTVRHKIARMAAAVCQARCFTYDAAVHWSQPKFDSAEAAIAKWTAGEAALAAAYEAIQLYGGYGYMAEYDVERYYREAKALTLIGGGNGLLLDNVAASVIGRIK